MKFFSEQDREGFTAADERERRTPLPVRTVASEEYLPFAQTAKQRESEQRLYVIADEIVPKLEMSRRRFIQASAGMAEPVSSGAQPGVRPVVHGRRC